MKNKKLKNVFLILNKLSIDKCKNLKYNIIVSQNKNT